MDKKLTELLELRKSIKAKKPKFVRQDANRMMNDKWRRPRGKSSKMRYGLRGYPRTVEPGWGSPKEVKGLHKSGLKMVLVCSLADLNKINNKTEGIIISKKIGDKKRILILQEAKKKGIIVLNLKNDYEKKIEEKLKLRKIKKEEKLKKKSEKKKIVKKAENKEELTEEQKKEAEKAEKDKILTKGN